MGAHRAYARKCLEALVAHVLATEVHIDHLLAGRYPTADALLEWRGRMRGVADLVSAELAQLSATNGPTSDAAVRLVRES